MKYPDKTIPSVMKFNELVNRLFHLRHEMGWVVLGQFLSFAGGFIGIKALTNIMGPTGYGQLALGLTIAGLLNMYIYGPVANVVARFFSVYKERGNLGLYFVVLKKAHRLLAITLTSLAVIAMVVVRLSLGSEWALIVVFSLFFGIVGGINTSYLSLQSAVRERKIVALHQGADIWLRTGIAVISLYFFSNSGYSALLGYLLGTFITTVSQNKFALKNIDIQQYWHSTSSNKTDEKACFNEFSSYAASFIIFAGFAAISMYADRWIVQGLFGESQVGIYSAIYQIGASPVNLLFTVVNQLIVPIVFERAGAMTSAAQAASSASLVRLAVVFSSVGMLFMTLVAYLFSEPIVLILTSSAFSGYHNILWISVLGLSIFNIGQLFSLKGLYHNQPKIYLWPKAWQAGSFLILAYFMAKSFGIIGVALALCSSSVIYLALVIIANNKIERQIAHSLGEVAA